MKRIIISAVAVAALAAPLAANAGPGHGHGHGKGRSAAHHTQGSNWTPPGLAKKPHGMPPGQAKKSWDQGERLPANYLGDRYGVREPSRVGLGPTPYGYRWVQVGDQYYLAQTQTGVVSQVLSALTR